MGRDDILKDVDDFLSGKQRKAVTRDTPKVDIHPKEDEKVSQRLPEKLTKGKKIMVEKGEKKGKIKYNDDGSIKEIYISQSLIKEFLYHGDLRDFCPHKVYHTMITGEQSKIVTLAMQKGNYFETGCLGAGTNGKIVDDLPRKRNGDKTIDQERIERQVDVFDQVVKKQGMVINKQGSKNQNVHVRQVKQWEDPQRNLPFKVWIMGEADIISPITWHNRENEMAIIDLKLTQSLQTDFGEFSWAEPKKMDHIQADIYSMLFDLPFYYLVFDYKASGGEHTIIPVNTLNRPEYPEDTERYKEAIIRRRSTTESIRKVVTQIEFYHEGGWNKHASVWQCKNCILSNKFLDQCKESYEINEI